MDIQQIETVTIEGVELASTGWWPFVTGPRWLTSEHLEDAVKAQDDPAIKTPIIKIGHTDPRFDGQPLFGSVTNLRLNNSKTKLLGDYVIATSLAPLVAKADEDEGEPPYPERSIEGLFDVKTLSGNEYSFVLTAIALLGEESPAIQDLADIVGIFTDEGEFVAASKEKGRGEQILMAGAVVDKIRFGVWEEIPADDQPWGNWSWVRHLEIDSASTGFVIVEDDDTAQLYRVPWTIEGDEVAYGPAEEVAVQFVAASRQPLNLLSFPRDNRASSGKPATVRGNANGPAAQGPEDEETSGLDPKELREKLGLEEDASDEDVVAKLTELTAEPDPDAPDLEQLQTENSELKEELAAAKKAEDLPEGVVMIDKTTLDSIKASASKADELAEDKRIGRRDSRIAAAVNEGKFAPSRKQHFSDLYDADPEGTEALINKLEANTIPVTERGHSQDPENSTDDQSSYPSEWLPEIKVDA